MLGKFGWETVAVVGTIGGDQQRLFKRPFDAERSAAEAERIRAERDELIAAYNRSDADATAADVDPEAAPELEVRGNAYAPDSNARVTASVTLDVTDAALIAPGQYRSSLVNDAIEQFESALLRAGSIEASRSGFCFGDGVTGEASIIVESVIRHDATTTSVDTDYIDICLPTS